MSHNTETVNDVGVEFVNINHHPSQRLVTFVQEVDGRIVGVEKTNGL